MVDSIGALVFRSSGRKAHNTDISGMSNLSLAIDPGGRELLVVSSVLPFKRDCVFSGFAASGGPSGRLAEGRRRRPPAANIGGVAAHCCGIFSCTNRPVWPVGGVVVAVTAFLVFIHHIIVFHGFSLFFIVF